ncbi:metallophosphoesterase [Planococcus shenhongbingii]|uniref:Metallophosphoesterase n=1 Tax=Planococcus shenhongbingii TaxID=3058398 RepID=A0ABT8NHM6_9BACL|nr:metallophosphoesterase [Planococcus sp. N017]MDN7247411.1 metallophosphoesterase [Planococcus sp. N017]
MNYFVIGDVHGCYYTFSNMINRYWDKENEVMVQVGDLIDRGKNSPQMVGLARQLSGELPEQANFLKGNHELEMQEHVFRGPNPNWLWQGGADTLAQYKNSDRDFKSDMEWLSRLPLFFETEHLFISHAGISVQAENPYIEDDMYGILWNRSPLKNIGKLQIIGHTPREKPLYDAKSHTWNIDTGAVYARYLTGVKVKPNGEIIEFLKEETDARDI